MAYLMPLSQAKLSYSFSKLLVLSPPQTLYFPRNYVFIACVNFMFSCDVVIIIHALDFVNSKIKNINIKINQINFALFLLAISIFELILLIKFLLFIYFSVMPAIDFCNLFLYFFNPSINILISWLRPFHFLLSALKLQTICIEQKIFHAHDHESFFISPRLFRSIHYNNLLK